MKSYIYQKDESMIANQVRRCELLPCPVMQIYHFRAHRIEDIIVLVKFLGLDVIAVLELQL